MQTHIPTPTYGLSADLSSRRWLPKGGNLDLWFLIAILWGVLFFLTPYQLDDWQFIGVYRDHNNGSDDFSLRAWLGYMIELRTNDNGRLANVLSPMSTLWKPWCYIFPWFTGCLVASIVWIVARIGFGRNVGWSGYGLVWFLMTILLPWRDSILVRDFSLNYVWGSFVTLSAIILIMLNLIPGNASKKAKCGPSGFRIVLFLITVPVVVIAGWWHEGFAFTSLCGLGVVTLIRRFRVGWRWWILIGIYAAVALLIVCAPGTLSRTSRELSDHTDPRGIRYLIDISPSIILLFTLIGGNLFRKGREYFRSLPLYFWLFSATALSSALLTLFINYSPRTCFWTSLTSLISLIICLRNLLFRIRKGRRDLLSLVLIALCLAQIVYVISWQVRYYHESGRIIALLEESPDGTIFTDVIDKSEVPPSTLFIPSRKQWVTPFNIICIDHALAAARGEVTRRTAVIPTSLKDLPEDISELKRVDSDREIYLSPDEKAFVSPVWDDIIIKPGDPFYIPNPLWPEITVTDGTHSNRDVYIFPFTSTHGQTLLYIVQPSVGASRIKSIKFFN